MKQISLILALVLIFSTGKIIAQEQERTIDNPEVQSLLALSDSIQSGEIGLLINRYRKDKSIAEIKEYKVIFYKTGKFNPFEVKFNYNILNVRDSMQYIFDGQTYYIIDHKNKICHIDTVACVDTATGIKSTCPYFLYPTRVFFNKMFCFYAQEKLRGLFIGAAIIDMQKIENTRFLKIERNSIAPGGSKKNKKTLWVHELEWDINKSTLFRYCEYVKDDTKYSKKTIVKRETFLTEASLNDEKYADAALYNGLNYAKSYKVIYYNGFNDEMFFRLMLM